MYMCNCMYVHIHFIEKKQYNNKSTIYVTFFFVKGDFIKMFNHFLV